MNKLQRFLLNIFLAVIGIATYASAELVFASKVSADASGANDTSTTWVRVHLVTETGTNLTSRNVSYTAGGAHTWSSGTRNCAEDGFVVSSPGTENER